MKLDELKMQVEVISKTVAGLREEISDKALVLLIQHAAPTVNGNKVPAKTIEAVLNGLECLEKFVLKEVE